MSTKICTKCDKEKELSEFHKNSKTKDGLVYFCKLCIKKYQKEFYTKFPEKAIFLNVSQRCENSKNPSYKYYGKRNIKNYLTIEDIKYLMIRDNYWDLNNPSIDRKENNKNYTLENSHFIEQKINTTERNVRVSSKPIIQLNLNNKFIKEFASTREVERKLGLDNSSISKCANGKLKTCGGFIWAYKENMK